MARKRTTYRFEGTEQEAVDPVGLERALEAWLLAVLRARDEVEGERGHDSEASV